MLCLLALVVVMLSTYIALLRYRGEHAEYSTCNTHLAEGYSQSLDVHTWKLLKRCSKSNAVPPD